MDSTHMAARLVQSKSLGLASGREYIYGCQVAHTWTAHTWTVHVCRLRALQVLDQCAEVLFSEVMLRSTGGGLRLSIEGRLKSLHSVYRKMVRKGCSAAEVSECAVSLLVHRMSCLLVHRTCTGHAACSCTGRTQDALLACARDASC